MWVRKLILNNIRCFEKESLDFSKKINIIVGPNNSGKSTIIRSLNSLQYPNQINHLDVRKTSTERSNVSIELHETVFPLTASQTDHFIIEPSSRSYFQRHAGLEKLPNNLPNNFIFPFISHRKVPTYQEDIREQFANEVGLNLSFLSAKLSVITNFGHPHAKAYQEACNELLGFYVGNIPSGNGMLPGTYINEEKVFLSSMGDGIAILVGFLITLLFSEGKLFIIEEPENDIHPRALKSLLNLIIKSSNKNQFIISTHSNIVVKALGSLKETNVFSLQASLNASSLTTTKVLKVTTSEERRNCLENLGYEFFDEDSYNAWIFFEESSAESIVRDYLIPWFCPKLAGRTRTFSCKSVNKIEKRFDEFNNLFCYLNLEAKYKNRAWVIVDAGEIELTEIESLKKRYKLNGWNENCFLQFSKHDFEEFYPNEFKKIYESEIKGKSSDKRKTLKQNLLLEVIDWCDKNPETAKVEFEKSALELINILRQIESELIKN